ncbi:Lrp/AsnC family transcriptional regulator [Microbulbifer sp. ZKSA006]|uniref:Lrp/AsnC family transcriptional regulator n=1 Tax=Microbulbifer sp. ZKSA006 TaxID=3243390 RepID=UPI004039407E
MAYLLDAIDKKILEILQRDATIPNIELAEKVCLSPSPCSRRVKNLNEQGFIKRAVTLLEPEKVGLPVSVFIQVTLNHQVKKELQDFESVIGQWPEVMECYLMTGDFDYLLRVVVPNLQAYQEFLDKKLTELPGIDHIKSSFSLKQVRYRTELPLDQLLESQG